MSETSRPPFLKLVETASGKSGMETDDVLGSLLPLMKQVRTAHEAGQVAPLDGLQSLAVDDQRRVTFIPEKAESPRKNLAGIEALQSPVSHGVEVVAETRRVADIDRSTLTRSDTAVASHDSPITKPVFLPSYRSWEHAVGHHDELTDIFSLGMLLASLACGLDFSDEEELEIFTTNRCNLFAINRRLNPVLASVIVQMTELNRHKRSPDLAQLVSRLEHYREQRVEFDTQFFGRKEFEDSPLAGKRRLIQSHLRDRLFEISRRNRLIYFKPTLQTLNLTVASVPLLLDYRNIKLEQLFVWHPALASAISEGAPMPLGKYLRFEEAPYIPGVLDKIISEARRDRAEYGFAQLRLVLCFLRWNNLKEAPAERIHSPLLLLPVELTRKKGVRDNYVLDPTSSEAEVNPALRHHLKELYNLNLPEVIDLKETSLDQFYDALKVQIQASEPGVALNKIDRPQIELIHEKARQRVDQYHRRIKLQARRPGREHKPDYSYDRENFRPLGLQLFLQKVRPAPIPLRQVMGATPQIRLPQIVENPTPPNDGQVLETERQMFSLRDGENQNPYSWDFDLCSLMLGNFNYRKMTLVRDYANLIETDLGSASFDNVFSLTPKPPEQVPPPLELDQQHIIIACDAAQASAIARARTGACYIIQGPPGTGKSQTITNLIADYAARGKRVLFVCEKRAAIDVVFHRLRQQGLDELCCLIHDSQTDKKAFIQNLKQTYEKLLSQGELDADALKARSASLAAMEQELASLKRFSDAMRQPHGQTGIAVRALLHRLVELGGPALDLPPRVEDILPSYPVWLQHGELVDRLRSVLADLGEDLCFATHPLRWLAKGVLQSDRPVETMTTCLDQVEDLVDAVESALQLSGLPNELWDTLEEIQTILEFAVKIRPLADKGLLGVLGKNPWATDFDQLASELDLCNQALAKARQKTLAWKEPLSPDDTQNALAQARACEKSMFRFLQPSFWRLKKTLQAKYDFSQHAVTPAWSKILNDLALQHEVQASLDETTARANQAWKAYDVQAFRALVLDLRGDPRAGHPSIQALMEQLIGSAEARAIVENLAAIHERFVELDRNLQVLLTEHHQFNVPQLTQVLGQLRDQTSTLAEMSALLGELAELPEAMDYALRRAEVPLGGFEQAIGHKSLNQVYRQDRAVSRFEGPILSRKMQQLEKHYRDWLSLNARCIRAGVRQKFVEHVNISSLPAAQLTPEQKIFKKTYSAGRRDLEHEFGKTMRYKSIRDLAAGDTGRVIQDLKPIWLMSPLSVSDTLPLEPDLFDVVIFDEASQIPLEEAIPAIYRSHQVIIVGDEMQLPPTTFFATSRGEDETVVVEEGGERVEVDLDSDSFLTQSARNLPSTLLAWHYRSRYESLISFSNAAFYSGNLFTIPDRQRVLENAPELCVNSPDQAQVNIPALLARSISFHFMQNGVYEDRTNPTEASYIARLVQGLLRCDCKLSIGIVAFSEAQQTEIESALSHLSAEDSEFAAKLEAEHVREENEVFCGLFVKNLENVQGDERDIIILSVCYGHDAAGRMLMNFGPINQRGGEKRLNVIFSRAKHHMAVVSSIRHGDITNDYNDGANSLKNFLQYAEAVSKGDITSARRVLENLNPLARKALAPAQKGDAVVDKLAAALRQKGYEVDLNVGQSKFRCDLAVRGKSDNLYQLGILVDTDAHYANPNLLDRYLMQPSILNAFGWRFALVLTKDWYHDPGGVLDRLEKVLKGDLSDDLTLSPDPMETEEEASSPGQPPLPSATVGVAPAEPVKPSPSPGHIRRFEFTSGASRKFWNISVSNNSFTVTFGRIGTAGQSQTKHFPDESGARREGEKLIAEKIKKGYVEQVG